MPRPGLASAFYYPLDEVFGTRAAVRVLRVLSLYAKELSASAIAAQARLTRGGAGRTLTQLVKRRVLRALGQGGSILYELDPAHPLADVIRALFRAEAERTERVFAGLRTAISALDPAPLAVWVFGSVARGEDRADSDLDVAIVAEPKTVRAMADRLRDEIERTVSDPLVHVSVLSFSTSDLRDMKRSKPSFWKSLNDDAIPLFGPAPAQLLSSRKRG